MCKYDPLKYMYKSFNCFIVQNYDVLILKERKKQTNEYLSFKVLEQKTEVTKDKFDFFFRKLVLMVVFILSDGMMQGLMQLV